jgi:predicted HTH domain antitoxin
MREMSEIIIDIPDETATALKLPRAEIADALRMAAAAKLYELGKLSSGAAAALAGVSRVAFLAKLADYGVDTFDMSEEQFAKETRLA